MSFATLLRPIVGRVMAGSRCFLTTPLKHAFRPVPLSMPSFNTNSQLTCIRQMSALRTRQAAAKRLLQTGSGKLKYGHCGKAHLNGNKSRKRLRRLAQKQILTGTYEKKMRKLIISGK